MFPDIHFFVENDTVYVCIRRMVIVFEGVYEATIILLILYIKNYISNKLLTNDMTCGLTLFQLYSVSSRLC